jgi:hypothetical protein
MTHVIGFCVSKFVHAGPLSATLCRNRSGCAADAAHRGHDIRIGAAAANISAHTLAYRVIILAARLFQQRRRGHDLPGRAIAALKSVVLQESRLYWVKFAILRQAFHRGYFIALVHDGESQARIHAPPIDVNCASATLPVVAAFFCAEKPEVLAQGI